MRRELFRDLCDVSTHRFRPEEVEDLKQQGKIQGIVPSAATAPTPDSVASAYAIGGGGPNEAPDEPEPEPEFEPMQRYAPPPGAPPQHYLPPPGPPPVVKDQFFHIAPDNTREQFGQIDTDLIIKAEKRGDDMVSRAASLSFNPRRMGLSSTRLRVLAST